MKTIKFASLRESRQESHNIEDYHFIPFEFQSGTRDVYNNVNLSVFVDDHCNANCKFCVAQLRFESRSQQFQKAKIKSDKVYFERVNEIFTKLRTLNPTISITGGEPSCSRRLVPLLQLIHQYGFRKRVITTNGSGLLNTVDGKYVIQHIIENKFQHINISKSHYIEDINKSIMKYDMGAYCSNEMLETIATMSLANNLRPRMSCVLLKEGIHDIDGMIKYMEFYKSMGIDNVIFRELMDFDKNSMINQEKILYNIDNKVKLQDIWHKIDGDSRFEPIRNIRGYYYYVEVYKYRGIDMVSESANLVKLYDEKKVHNNIVYEMVFHPNGNLNGSWVDNEDILEKMST